MGLADMYRQHPIIGSTILGAMGVAPGTISQVNRGIKGRQQEGNFVDVDIEIENMLEKMRKLDTDIALAREGRLKPLGQSQFGQLGNMFNTGGVNYPR